MAPTRFAKIVLLSGLLGLGAFFVSTGTASADDGIPVRASVKIVLGDQDSHNHERVDRVERVRYVKKVVHVVEEEDCDDHGHSRNRHRHYAWRHNKRHGHGHGKRRKH